MTSATSLWLLIIKHSAQSKATLGKIDKGENSIPLGRVLMMHRKGSVKIGGKYRNYDSS